MTRVLVVKEKHGTRYFDVSTDVKLAQVCCKLLRERLVDGYYQPGEPPTGEIVADDILARLPADLQAVTTQHNQLIRQAQQQHKDAGEVALLVREVTTSPQILYSGRQVRAWTLLRASTDPDDVELFDIEIGSETMRPDCISEELHFRMEQEGWSIFDHDGRPQVMKLDERGVLTDDEQAWELARAAGLTIDAEGYLDETQPGQTATRPTKSLTAHSFAKQLLSEADRPILITDLETCKTRRPRVLDVRHSFDAGQPAAPAWLLTAEPGGDNVAAS